MTSLTGRCQPLTSPSWLGCAGVSLPSTDLGTFTSAGAPGFVGDMHRACHVAERDLIILQLEGW